MIVIVAQIRCLRTQSSAAVDFISTNGSVNCCLTFYATWNCENSSFNCSCDKSISQWIQVRTKWYMGKKRHWNGRNEQNPDQNYTKNSLRGKTRYEIKLLWCSRKHHLPFFFIAFCVFMTKHNLQMWWFFSYIMMCLTQTQYKLLDRQVDIIADKNVLSIYLKMCFSFVLWRHRSNKHERRAVLLFWKAVFIVKRRSSDDWLRQSGRASMSLSGLSLLYKCLSHLEGQQCNLVNLPAGKRPAAA